MRGNSRFLLPTDGSQSIWSIDSANDFEDYLLKICSGDEEANFDKAALSLESSIKTYGLKVEHLYALVLRAVEFISKRSHVEQTTVQSAHGRGGNQADVDESNDVFLDLDDVPVDAQRSLDEKLRPYDNLNQFVKPPWNSVVLEGECFDPTGEAGELEAYLLSTCGLYLDFLLLDPCDAEEIEKFVKACKASSVRSKGHKTCGQTPSRTSCLKSSQKYDANLTKSPMTTSNHDNIVRQDPPDCNFYVNEDHGDDNKGSERGSISENDNNEDDPWKPLNPHEPGTLKVKPFRKGNIHKRRKLNPGERISIAMQFPIAKLTGIIDPQFTEMCEAKNRAFEIIRESTNPPFFEQLRESLIIGESDPSNPFGTTEAYEGTEPAHDIPVSEQDDIDMPENTFMDVGELSNANKGGKKTGPFESTDFGRVVPEQEDFEDLCRSHLDDLLASITGTEMHTELATRVSTWKQRIERTLEDQDSHPPFDTAEYGKRVLNKLLLEADSARGSGIPFTDVVKGNEEHDVARTFHALLQLVNQKVVDLVKSDARDTPSLCYTATNPFSVRLLAARETDVQLGSSKKRAKSP